MRRFIYAVALAGMLSPATVLAHAGEEPVTASGGDTANENTSPSAGAVATTIPISPTPGEQTSVTTFDQRIRGSTLILDQSTTPDTLFAGAQQSQVSSYQWWISFRPRFYITHDLSVRARADMTMEFFPGAADTTHIREYQWGDIWTELVYSGLSFHDLKFALGIRALWPVSLAARARSMYVTLGATAGASYTINHFPGSGSLALGLSFAGQHEFDGRVQGGMTQSVYGCSSGAFELPGYCDSTGGPMNGVFSLYSIATLTYSTPVTGLSVGLMYLLSNTWAYPTTDVTLTDQMGGTYTVPRSGNDTRMRQNGWFLFNIDYEVTRWLTMSLGYYSYRPVLDPSSQYGNPFYAPGGVSRIYLEATIPLDALYQAITHTGPAARGHASNRTPPQTSGTQIASELRRQRLMNGTF